MALQIEQREVEAITILDLEGRLVLGVEAGSFQDALTALLEAGKTRLILDLEKLSFIDSTGLGVLVVARTSFEKAQGVVKLLHLSKRHIQLLVLTKLITLFETFDDERSAIDSFYPERKRFDILEFVKMQQDEPQPADKEEEPPLLR